MATIFHVCLLLLILIPSALAVLCNPADKKALLQLKQDLNNPDMISTWVPDDSDCCYWPSVRCDRKTHRVISLYFFSRLPFVSNFSSQIPPSIANFPHLQYLFFHKLANLTGPIPPAIANLTALTDLVISWTNLSGPIPSFLSRLKNLTSLDLSFNNLSGRIPHSLSQLSNLGALFLGRNHLTGPIPESLGYFKSSYYVLDLSHNNLSGHIPSSFMNLNLSSIDLSRNRLEGDASMLFGHNKTVEWIVVSRNQLAFNLSKVVMLPGRLSILDVSHNKVFGSIPAELTERSLQHLNVSYNRLCGEIPVGGDLQSFDIYSYFHNKCLCGSPLPACK